MSNENAAANNLAPATVLSAVLMCIGFGFLGFVIGGSRGNARVDMRVIYYENDLFEHMQGIEESRCSSDFDERVDRCIGVVHGAVVRYTCRESGCQFSMEDRK